MVAEIIIRLKARYVLLVLQRVEVLLQQHLQTKAGV